MKKIKEIVSNAYEVAKNSNKTAKIISFFVGFFFNIIGIIAVAVWKLIFSKDEKKNKYCIRLSILGLITKVVIFSKIFSFLLFSNLFTDGNWGDKGKGWKYSNHRPAKISVFDDFDREFARMHKRMNRIFEEQQKVFDDMFDGATKEQIALEKEMKNIEEKHNKDVQIKKEVKNENGFETTTIEKTSPNSYSQHTTIKYVGEKGKDKAEKFNNKQKSNNGKPSKINKKREK